MTALLVLIAIVAVCALGGRFGADSRFDRPGRRALAGIAYPRGVCGSSTDC